MEAVMTLLTVVQKIIKAAEAVRGNQIRCQRLAVRVRDLGAIISLHRDSLTSTAEAGGGVTALLTTSPLESLTAVLDDALELVEACQLHKSGFVGRVEDLLTSESMATRFQDVDTRITACVGDLNYAEGKAARLRDDRYRAKALAPPAQEAQRQQQQRYQAQSAPPVKLSKQPWPSSLQSFHEQSAPPPPPPFKQPLPPALQRFLKQSAPPSMPPPQPMPAPPPPPPFKQSAQPLPPSLQRFLMQSAPPQQQQRNVVQPSPQATPLLLLQRRYLARSATPPKLPQQHCSVVLPPVPQPQQCYSTLSPPMPSELAHRLRCAARDAAV